MNAVHLIGNLARDPEVKTVTVGGDRETKVANFTVATTRYFKKRDGENSKETTFVPCEAWDTGAASIEKLLKKGDPVAVDGSLKMEQWENAEGVKCSKMKVRVDRFQKLNRKAPDDAVASDVEKPELVTAGATDSGDEIPF